MINVITECLMEIKFTLMIKLVPNCEKLELTLKRSI